jgi:hypothetical protein
MVNWQNRVFIKKVDEPFKMIPSDEVLRRSIVGMSKRIRNEHNAEKKARLCVIKKELEDLRKQL